MAGVTLVLFGDDSSVYVLADRLAVDESVFCNLTQDYCPEFDLKHLHPPSAKLIIQMLDIKGAGVDPMTLWDHKLPDLLEFIPVASYLQVGFVLKKLVAHVDRIFTEKKLDVNLVEAVERYLSPPENGWAFCRRNALGPRKRTREEAMVIAKALSLNTVADLVSYI